MTSRQTGKNVQRSICDPMRPTIAAFPWWGWGKQWKLSVSVHSIGTIVQAVSETLTERYALGHNYFVAHSFQFIY